MVGTNVGTFYHLKLLCYNLFLNANHCRLSGNNNVTQDAVNFKCKLWKAESVVSRDRKPEKKLLHAIW
jgi:hypothetical protein